MPKIYDNIENHLTKVEEMQPKSFSIAHSSGVGYMDFLYYSTVTLGTIGYGDVTPVTVMAKIMTMLEIFAGMATLVLIIANYKEIFTDKEESIVQTSEVKVKDKNRRNNR